MNKFLFKQIDNTGLVLFRIVFGLLISLEAFGAIATGWVTNVLVKPQFTFNFIGFDFLQVFQGPGMYAYFVVMGIFGLMVMFGYKYRLGMLGYALLWTGVYLMQKTSYNNHYYLMMLLCWIMIFLPANGRWSLDAKLRPALRKIHMPSWCKWVLVLQVFIIFTYGSIAKCYPDWIDGSAVLMFMKGKRDYWLIGSFLQVPWVHLVVSYVGIVFDLLIIPMLLWKRTRLLGFWLSVFFHLFNSVVFQIGIFPYMSIAFALLFFSSETLQKVFRIKKREIYSEVLLVVPHYKKVMLGFFTIYFIFQIGLPLRHWTFEDDVLWTEEGHRLSWRMMLRSKQGTLSVSVEDKETKSRETYLFKELLSKKQARSIRTHPDMLWQLAKKIKEIEAKKGKDVAVYLNGKVSVNGGPYFPFIDNKIDIASQEWNHFSHTSWVLPSPKEYHERPESRKNPLQEN